MMNAKPRISIIGSGALGCFIGLELARYFQNITIIEKSPASSEIRNQSVNNSGVLHSGINYDQTTRPLKAGFCVEGNRLLYKFCRRYGVPYRQNGKLIVATESSQEKALENYLTRGQENQVPGVELLSAKQIYQIEPRIRATAGLWVPSSGVLSPTVLMKTLTKVVQDAGVRIINGQKVGLIESRSNGDLQLETQGLQGRRPQTADWVINAAGVLSVALAKKCDPDLDVQTALLRGDSYRFKNHDKTGGQLNGTSIYPPPIQVRTPTGTHHTVGVHLTPIWNTASVQPSLGNTYLIGPRLTPVNHEEDFQTPPPPPEEYISQTPFFDGLNPEDLEYFHGAVQARLDGYQDFYIQRDRQIDRVIHLLGIDSPGLTSAPAIARSVLKMIMDED